jgi:hypothetical protein
MNIYHLAQYFPNLTEQRNHLSTFKMEGSKRVWEYILLALAPGYFYHQQVWESLI